MNDGLPTETGGFDPLLVAGIAAYRRHPWERAPADAPVLWQDGGTNLLDYAPGSPDPVVMFVPSLVNRAYILDFLPGRSMLRWFAGNGFRPLLLDWGWPDADARRFTLTDYVAGRLEGALAVAGGQHTVALAGYCMGGLLALAASLRRPDRIAALALLATPWDFSAGREARALSGLLPLLEPSIRALDGLPVDILQSLLSVSSADRIAARYRAFAKLDQGSTKARTFVALEDWLADGVPLAAPVARECIGGWYGANTTARGRWRIAGGVVDPAALRVPAFVAVPDQDRVVPPASARPLATLIPDAVSHAPAAGHVGMAAGSKAETMLWLPLATWLRQAFAKPKPRRRKRA